MNLGEKAFFELFGAMPEKKIEIKYSGKFSDYNANVKYDSSKMEFGLSRKWEGVSEEIAMGLIQSLLVKIHKRRKPVTNFYLELYDNFIKNVSKFSVGEKVDPFLRKSFERVNERYFNGMMELPNLVWGRDSTTKLGSYDYCSNTIMISRVLAEREELLDYVMYHEMLHKKHKFKTKNGRSLHHSKEFKEDERKFHVKDVEKQLKSFLRKKKVVKRLKFW